MNARQRAEHKRRHEEYRAAEDDYRSIVTTASREELLAAYSRLVAASRAVQDEDTDAEATIEG
jgi:hypothetical protein